MSWSIRVSSSAHQAADRATARARTIELFESERLELGVEVGVLGDGPGGLFAVLSDQTDSGPAELENDLLETVSAGLAALTAAVE